MVRVGHQMGSVKVRGASVRSIARIHHAPHHVLFLAQATCHEDYGKIGDQRLL